MRKFKSTIALVLTNCYQKRVYMGTVLAAFRLDAKQHKKMAELAEAKGIKKPEAYREAVKEYLALYVVGSDLTVGRLKRKIDDLEKRLTTIENLLMEKGAQR